MRCPEIRDFRSAVSAVFSAVGMADIMRQFRQRRVAAAVKTDRRRRAAAEAGEGAQQASTCPRRCARARARASPEASSNETSADDGAPAALDAEATARRDGVSSCCNKMTIPVRSARRAERRIASRNFRLCSCLCEIIYKLTFAFLPNSFRDLPAMASLDSFKCRKKLTVGAKTYHYFSLKAAEKNGLEGISQLPYSMKVLLENLLRNEDGRSVTKEDILGFAEWLENKGKTEKEIAFRPARVLMQDFTGVPAVVDLAAMRDAHADARRRSGEDQSARARRSRHRPFGHRRRIRHQARRSRQNVELEYERNGERYRFLKWGQGAFDNFRVVPPGTGICHQVNLEYLAQTVWTRKEKFQPARGKARRSKSPIPTRWSAPIRTPPWSMASPCSAGASAASRRKPPCSASRYPCCCRKSSASSSPASCKEGVTATDLVLTVTQMLRKKGVVGKFVEFFGPGLDALSLADRATIANMAPGIWRDLRLLPDRRRNHRLSRRPSAASRRASRWSRNTPRRRACSAPAPPRSGLHRHARTRSRHGRPVARRAEAPGGPHRARRRRTPASPPRWTANIRSLPSCPSVTRSRARISISATATWSSPRSPPAPTPRTRAC